MVSTGPERDETILLQHPFQDWWKNNSIIKEWSI
jgi:hypothetical protein